MLTRLQEAQVTNGMGSNAKMFVPTVAVNYSLVMSNEQNHKVNLMTWLKRETKGAFRMHGGGYMHTWYEFELESDALTFYFAWMH